MTTVLSPNIDIRGELSPSYTEILSSDALDFIAHLQRKFNPRRLALLALRKERQAEIDKGILPDFLPQTAHIRSGNWKVAPLPTDLLDRRVEITGPVDRKMVINALNSGANVFMADFEDANAPLWANNVDGQINLRDAVRKNISYTNPNNEKTYHLNEQTATLMVRPRGWHLPEKHLFIDGEPVSASLFDFGLFFFHNAHTLIQKGTAPYFYLPKLESHLEAQLWNDIFIFAQQYIGIPQGTIKATVLIETILAAFEMDEILYELREHSAGLNCGRWDYIFSIIKKFRNNPAFLMPDRAQVTMSVACMKAYSNLLIQTCHKRGVSAMGGMAAQIPIKNNPEANQIALDKVRADKQREAADGHDGTWVAHPALVAVAKEIFDQLMPKPNQIDRLRSDLSISAAELLEVPKGTITEKGVRTNINVGILYTESWLQGVGAAAIYNLMEDAATAEISRSQLWQWLYHPEARLDDGRKITLELYQQLFEEEGLKIKEMMGETLFAKGKYTQATAIFNQLATDPNYQDFLTITLYNLL